MVPLDVGHGRIRDTLPVREVVGELKLRYQIIIEYKSYFYDFQQDTFPRNAFHEIQEKHDGEKSRKPRLLIFSVGHIVRQQIIDI